MSLQTPTPEQIYAAAAAAGARPDPFLTISQWADKYRWLSQRASAEAGQWRTDRTPYLREIMDCLSPSSGIERTVFMKGAQIGGTECGNNWIGYVIHQAPGPMMAVQPTVEMAKRNSKQRVDPLIEKSEVLRKLVHDPPVARLRQHSSIEGVPGWSAGDDRCQLGGRPAVDGGTVSVPRRDRRVSRRCGGRRRSGQPGDGPDAHVRAP
jgi:hypothetical protein